MEEDVIRKALSDTKDPHERLVMNMEFMPAFVYVPVVNPKEEKDNANTMGDRRLQRRT